MLTQNINYTDPIKQLHAQNIHQRNGRSLTWYTWRPSFVLAWNNFEETDFNFSSAQFLDPIVTLPYKPRLLYLVLKSICGIIY